MIARLFFIFWIRSNIFRDFLGCRRSILISKTVIRFVLKYTRSVGYIYSPGLPEPPFLAGAGAVFLVLLRLLLLLILTGL